MTPDMQQARDGYRRQPAPRWDAGGAPVPGPPSAGPARRAQPAGPGPAAPPAPDDRRTGRDPGTVEMIPLLAVLVAVVAGVVLAWRQGSSGAGEGGVIAGAALLAGAAVRLLLPPRLAGLLVNRNRATDVVTLAVLGVGLLVAGLVLPRLARGLTACFPG
jgi:hypothetical protein